MAVTNKGLGWRRQLPDARDFRYATPPHVLRALPPVVDLRPQMPCPVWDQGQLGSCTSHALCAAFVYAMAHAQTPSAVPLAFEPSRLFHYYCERVMENTVESDAGADLRAGAKCLATQGVCSSATWPYDITQFSQKPPDAAYTEATMHESLQYAAVAQDLASLKGALADNHPIAFGFTVYDSFMSDSVAQSGIMPMPASTEHVQGGHAVVAVGYDDSTQMVLARNSWGVGWGQQGHFWMPMVYLTSSDLSADFWTIDVVSG